MKRLIKLLKALNKKYKKVVINHNVYYDDVEQSLVLCVSIDGNHVEFLVQPDEFLEPDILLEEVCKEVDRCIQIHKDRDAHFKKKKKTKI